MMSIYRDSVQDPEFVALQQEAKELDDFVHTEILPLKLAFRCYGMETIDFDELIDAVKVLFKASQKCRKEYEAHVTEVRQRLEANERVEEAEEEQGRRMIHSDDFVLDFYSRNPNVLELQKQVKAIIESSRPSQSCIEEYNKLCRQLNCIRIHPGYYIAGERGMVLNSPLFPIVFNDERTPYHLISIGHSADLFDYERVYLNHLRNWQNMQNTFYRYKGAANPEHRFSRFDDILYQIRVHIDSILKAKRRSDLRNSIAVLRKENKRMMGVLEEYLRFNRIAVFYVDQNGRPRVRRI